MTRSPDLYPVSLVVLLLVDQPQFCWNVARTLWFIVCKNDVISSSSEIVVVVVVVVIKVVVVVMVVLVLVVIAVVVVATLNGLSLSPKPSHLSHGLNS